MDLRRGLKIALVVLVGFLVARTILPSIISIVASPLSWMHRLGSYAQALLRFPSVYEEYTSLKRRSLELDFYRHYVSVLKEENERLRTLLDMPSPKEFKSLVADVLIRPQERAGFFYINRGSKDGVMVGFGVMAPGKVMAGRVVRVWPHLAKVAYPWDLGFSATVIDEGTREEGMLVGDGEKTWLRFVSSNSQVQVGDVVRTSSLSLFFPAGILVGEVVNFSCQPGYVECKAEVNPCIKGMTFYQAIVLIPESDWVKELLAE